MGVATKTCRSCRRLRSFDLACKKQNQKIAAFGSSYRGVVVTRCPLGAPVVLRRIQSLVRRQDL
ncbi:hypothetical protein C9422_20840 [Pseudomonas sp. B1(2018)]|nr:hypothetical protein C9422_20840 [Pseudomonas sp. B1(2018)]